MVRWEPRDSTWEPLHRPRAFYEPRTAERQADRGHFRASLSELTALPVNHSAGPLADGCAPIRVIPFFGSCDVVELG